jgi:3-hydroxy-9,10-secoandrosta-1,3,5(10)-triene-9,17-dione monooxygenase reductase component
VTPSDVQDQELRQINPLDGKALRRVCGLFVTGVTVITSGVGAEAAGTTVNSFTSVSLDPPLVLFCLHNDSRLLPVVTGSGAYAVNFLTHWQEELAMAFAGRHTANLEAVPHHLAAPGVPVLSEALAFLACRLVNAFDGGDHTIFVGEVVEFAAPTRKRQPLIFYRGALGALEEEPHGAHPIFDG